MSVHSPFVPNRCIDFLTFFSALILHFQDEASDEPLPPPPEDLKPPEEPLFLEQNGTEIVESTKVFDGNLAIQFTFLCFVDT